MITTSSSITLQTPAADLVRFGQKLKAPLKRLGIETVRDLLLYFPSKHEDFRNRKTIGELAIGQSAVVAGRLRIIANRRSWKKGMTITEAILEDATGSIRLIWFRQPYVVHLYRAGDEVVACGILRENRYGAAMIAPTLEKVSRGELIHTAGIVAQYPLTKGVSHKQLRLLVRQALPAARSIEDWIPREVIRRERLLALFRAIEWMHVPLGEKELASARRRFAFEELFLFQCQAQYVRSCTQRKTAPSVAFDELWFRALVASLPYTLTVEQKKAIWTIVQDIGKTTPMNRLLVGDVGTGKTAVAALALALVAHDTSQGILLAPTEVLAKQHFDRVVQLLHSTDITVGLYTANHHAVAKGGTLETLSSSRELKRQLAAGDIGVVIGTHALLAKNVEIPEAALVVVDEQHRFGVEQRRSALTHGSLGQQIPHHCSMSATPIPRTFALAFFGDFDLSILTEFPQGRRSVETLLIDPETRRGVEGAIRETIERGEQIFVVCSRISESDRSGRKSVERELERLKKDFPRVRWGALHGRMGTKEQQQVMNDLNAKLLDGVVATTVVEVGVDIPNASLLIVEGAEAFGLSQLHQLRGRIGRIGQKARCLLVPSADSGDAGERLQALVDNDDGWKIAEMDLKLRGPGTLLGSSQSGDVKFRFADFNDRELLQAAHQEARAVLEQSPTLERFPMLKERVIASG